MRSFLSGWSRYFWPIAWGVACAAIAALIVFQLHVSDLDESSAPASPAKVADARLLPPVAAPAQVSASDETTSRPLFVPARRPSPPAPVDAAPAFKRGQFALQGTIVAGDESLAFLRELSSGKVRRVAKGEKIADLTLSEVTPTSVTLVLGEDAEKLPLQVAKGPPPAAAAPQRAGVGSPQTAPTAPPAAGDRAAAASDARSQPAEAVAASRRSRFLGQGAGGAGGSLQGILGRSRPAAPPQVTPPAPQQKPDSPNPSGADAAAPSGEITFAEIARRRARDMSTQPK